MKAIVPALGVALCLGLAACGYPSGPSRTQAADATAESSETPTTYVPTAADTPTRTQTPTATQRPMPSIAGGHFGSVGSPQVPRSAVAPVLMRDGRVLVAGGCCQAQPLPGALNWDLASGTMKSAEIFDPDTGSFTFTGELVSAGAYGTATLLPSGRVLVVLGSSVDGGNPAEIYDPATGTFSLAGGVPLGWAAELAVLLRDGRVLLIGAVGPGEVATAELYDEKTSQFEDLGQLDGQARLALR